MNSNVESVDIVIIMYSSGTAIHRRNHKAVCLEAGEGVGETCNGTDTPEHEWIFAQRSRIFLDSTKLA
jgi:hypothetical protein